MNTCSARADSRMCVVDSGWMCSPGGSGVRGGRFEQAAPRSWDGAVDCVLDHPQSIVVYGESYHKIILECYMARGNMRGNDQTPARTSEAENCSITLRSGGSVLFKRLPTTRAQICTDGPLAQAFHVKAVPTY